VDGLLTDLGLDFAQRFNIETNLCYIVKVYNENKSTISLTDISKQLFDCIRPVATDAATITSTELATCIFLVLLATIILMLLVPSRNYLLMIFLFIYFGILYIIIIYLIINNCGLTISSKIDDSETRIEQCINKALANLDLYFNVQEEAVNKALCAYGSGKCIIPT
jgi:hypothetical protein